MFPRLLKEPITIPTYGVLVAIGFMIALWITHRQARKAGMDVTAIMDLSIYTLIAGLIGAKLALVAVDLKTYIDQPRELLSVIRSGGVFYGGFIAGLPVAAWFLRRSKMKVLDVLDILVPGLAIGQAIGRLGCLAAGCCWGKPTTAPWAITFHDLYAAEHIGTPLYDPRHPTQLYETLATLLLFFIALWLLPRKRFSGQVASIYLIGYAVLRFIIEFFRGDSNRGLWFNHRVSTSQIFATVFFAFGLALYIVLMRKKTRERQGAAPGSAA
ncbi:MAG: prolipoprotein diacylglyceryl transferase [Vicinamibacteria bacterium]|jgi:phosphatidylglycerol:prolipoprotein diacylglycerol transferase|nr:prolipoprotein diacylglyceryl transferase [Vicinamibacteria bacterium]